MRAPRGLAFALSLGALIALVIALSGSELTLAAALCLVVLPLVALCVVLASSRRNPSPPEVARVLDRDLALDERLGTAVEISGAGFAVDGLAALVLAEANAVLATNRLGGARPTHRSARREWLVAAGALLIISGLLVLISGRGDSLGPGQLAAASSAGHLASQTSVASGGGTNHPRRSSGRTRNIGPGAKRATTPSVKSASRNPALSVVAPPKSSTAGGRLAPGGHQRTPPGAAGRSGSQTAGLGAKAGTPGAGGGASSRAGSSSSAQATTHSAGSSRGGTAGSSRGTSGRSHTTNPQRVGGGSHAGTFGANPTSGSLGSAKAPASANSPAHGTGRTRVQSARSAGHTGRSPSSHGHSVGNGAGSGSGGNLFGGPQTKGLPSRFGGRRLPIQAGNTSARNGPGPKTGNPAGRSGGKGPARSSTEHGGGSAATVSLPYIPPSADIGLTDSALLQHYFSSAPTVTGRW